MAELLELHIAKRGILVQLPESHQEAAHPQSLFREPVSNREGLRLDHFSIHEALVREGLQRSRERARVQAVFLPHVQDLIEPQGAFKQVGEEGEFPRGCEPLDAVRDPAGVLRGGHGDIR